MTITSQIFKYFGEVQINQQQAIFFSTKEILLLNYSERVNFSNILKTLQKIDLCRSSAIVLENCAPEKPRY